MVVKIFSRHGKIESEEHDTLDNALYSLWYLNEVGEGFPIGVIDEIGHGYVPQCHVADHNQNDMVNILFNAATKLGMEEPRGGSIINLNEYAKL